MFLITYKYQIIDRYTDSYDYEERRELLENKEEAEIIKQRLYLDEMAKDVRMIELNAETGE